jgi:Tfp pilus assembly protein PilO
MNKQAFILTIIILAIIFIAWQLFWPAFVEVSDLRQELATWQDKLKETQDQKTKLVNLKQKYESLSNEEQKITEALPSQEDIPSLLVQVEALASQNGLILDSINLSSLEETKKSKTSTQASPVPPVGTLEVGSKPITIDLALSGNSGALKNFLKAVESNLRLMDVTSVSFGESAATAPLTTSGLVTFKVSLNAYYAK